jgi:hypothetical protein
MHSENSNYVQFINKLQHADNKIKKIPVHVMADIV